MIKNRQQFFNQLHVVLDALMIFVSYALAYIVRFILIGDEKLVGGPYAPENLRFYFKNSWIIVLGYLFLYVVFRLYTPKRTFGRKKEFLFLVEANIVGGLILTTILYMAKEQNYSRSLILVFAIMNTVCITVERNFVRLALNTFRKKGYNLKHVLIVGYSLSAEALIDRIMANPQWGYYIHGILDDQIHPGETYKGISIIGQLSKLESILAANDLDEIMISLRLSEYNKLKQIVDTCEKSGVHTKFIPDYNRIIPTTSYTEDWQGVPVINIRHVPLMYGGNKAIKRLGDIVGSLLCIVIFSPVMLISAIIVKLTSKGPVLFMQERVGLHNRPFKMYKFRSMVQQRDEEEKTKWTTKNDSRITPYGGFMRKTSIDELPQLFNVLKGEMSLVGPRPERPFFVDQFKENIPRYMIKHQVRPGMTGWAQVHGLRGDTSIADRIDYDLYYIEHWNPLLDLKILVMTVFVGFVNKNAY